MEPISEVLDINEAAAFLKVSKDTVYHLARAKKIPAKHVGRQWRFSRTALEKYLGIPEQKKAVGL